MSQNKNSETSELKSLIRALEDRRDLRIQSSIEKEFLKRDLAEFKDKANNELKHNNRLKKTLQQLKEVNKVEQGKHDIVSSMRSTLRKGNFNKVLTFSKDQLEQYKTLLKAKQFDFEKKLKDHIDDHTKNNPLYKKYEQKKMQVVQLEQQLKTLEDDEMCFIEKMKNDRQVNNLLFQQNVVEMSQFILRYYDLTERLKNPNKIIRKPSTAKLVAKMIMSKREATKSLQPVAVSNENQINDQNIPEASSTSNEQEQEQETFDLANDDLGQDFDLTSPERSGMRLNKRVEKKQRFNDNSNKEPTGILKASKSRSILNKQNAKDDIQRQKNRYNSEQAKYAKQPMPSVSSKCQVTTEGPLTSQKSQNVQKAKVTFADTIPSQSSSFKTVSKDKGVSSSTFQLAAVNELDIDMDMELSDNENQISDNGNDDVQMDDNEEKNSDIDDDQISNWTSLEVTAGNFKQNNKQISSPESRASSFDMDFMKMPLQKNNNASKSTGNDFFNMSDNDFMNDMGDMEAFFK